MKIKEFLEKQSIDLNSLWAKKFSDIHLPTEDRFSGTTLCGTPMLGNNYATVAVAENREVCAACLGHHKFGEPVTAWGDLKQGEVVKKPKVKLSGMDGNVFGLIGTCSKALKKAGQPENAKKMSEECFKAGSYNEALQIMMKYCDVR